LNGTTRRLLLVEFLESERCRNDKLHFFPFYAALAKQQGAVVEYLSYGAEYVFNHRVGHCGYYTVDLVGDDLESLAGVVRQFRPTHILSSEIWSQAMVMALAEIAPDAEYLSFSDWGYFLAEPTTLAQTALLDQGEIVKLPSTRRISTLWDQLSLDPQHMPYKWFCPELVPDGFLVDLDAMYATRMMNEAAFRVRAFIRVIGGHHCTSQVRWQNNPFFKGLDLSRWKSQQGCTFCQVSGLGARMIRYPRPHVEQAIRQLKRIIECTGTTGRNSCEYDIYDTWVFYEVERFFEILLEMGFPPGCFHFSPRINDMLTHAPALERIMPRLVKAGYSVNILRIGLENFSPDEQLRYNKGISLQEQKDVIAAINSLKQKYPDNFSTKEFGYILFNPWTTLNDIKINIDVAREVGFTLSPYLISTGMQLDYNTPMLEATIRDDLYLGEEPTDAAYLYATFVSKSLRPFQKYWRFKDPIVAVLFETVVRICAHIDEHLFGAFFSRDDARFQACIDYYHFLRGNERRTDIMLETLLEACRRWPSMGTTYELLDAARELNAQRGWREKQGLALNREDEPEVSEEEFISEHAYEYSPNESKLKIGLPLLKTLLSALAASPASPLPGWTLGHLGSEIEKTTGFTVRFDLVKSEFRLNIAISAADRRGSGYIEGRFLRLSHGDTKVDVAAMRGKLEALLKLVEHYLFVR